MIINNYIKGGWAEFDRQHGLHSNIPSCCVDEFVSCQEAFDGSSFVLEQNKRKRALLKKYNLVGAEYCMCWTCLYKYIAGKIQPVEIHQCVDKEESELCRDFIEVREALSKEFQDSLP